MTRIKAQRTFAYPLLLACLLLTACDQSSPTATPNPSTASPTPLVTGNDNTPVAPPTAIVAPTTPAGPTPTPRPPSSADKIAAAEAAGKLDHDTALLYYLYADYDLASLPTEYHGDDSASSSEATTTLAEISQRFDQMSADLKQKIQPFLERPDNPQSFWYQHMGKPQASARMPGLAMPGEDQLDFAYIDAQRTPIRVWYLKDSAGQGKQLASNLTNEIDSSGMWAKEQKAMLNHTPCSDAQIPPPNDGGSPSLDIYLIYPGSTFTVRGGKRNLAGADGLTVPQAKGQYCPEVVFVLLNAGVSFDTLKASAAHELFHTFQFSFKLGPQADWWIEASATWAEDLVYPELDQEQDYLQDSQWVARPGATVDGPLDEYQDGGLAQYGAYIWPFYLRQAANGSETVIGQLWQASEGKRPLDAMHDMQGWEDKFKQFALWNWNRAPEDKYRDHGEHILQLTQSAPCLLNTDCIVHYQSDPYSLPVELGHTQVGYYDLGRPDTDYAQLRLDLSDMLNKEGEGVQAIITLAHPNQDDEFQVVDWSRTSERKFCLDREDVKNILLIVSNSSVTSGYKLKGAIKVQTLKEGCAAAANFTYDVNANYGLDANSPSGSVKGTANSSMGVESVWQLQFDRRDSLGNLYYSFVATNTINLNSGGNMTGSGPGGATWNAQEQVSGSYTSHNPPLPQEEQYKWYKRNGQTDEAISSTLKGSIYITTQPNGTRYAIGFPMSQVAPRYSYSSHTQSPACGGLATNDQSFDSASLQQISNSRAPGICGPGDSSTNTLPYSTLYGLVNGLIDPPFKGGDQHHRLEGTFDPAIGLIDGSDTFESDGCDVARSLDPLYSIVNQALDARGLGQPSAETCHVHYTMHWHLQLPPHQ